MNKLIQVSAILLITGATLMALGGCSVNVIVAPHATLAVESDLSQNAAQLVEAPDFGAPGYDCIIPPASDACQ